MHFLDTLLEHKIIVRLTKGIRVLSPPNSGQSHRVRMLKRSVFHLEPITPFFAHLYFHFKMWAFEYMPFLLRKNVPEHPE